MSSPDPFAEAAAAAPVQVAVPPQPDATMPVAAGRPAQTQQDRATPDSIWLQAAEGTVFKMYGYEIGSDPVPVLPNLASVIVNQARRVGVQVSVVGAPS